MKEGQSVEESQQKLFEKILFGLLDDSVIPQVSSVLADFEKVVVREGGDLYWGMEISPQGSKKYIYGLAFVGEDELTTAADAIMLTFPADTQPIISRLAIERVSPAGRIRYALRTDFPQRILDVANQVEIGFDVLPLENDLLSKPGVRSGELFNHIANSPHAAGNKRTITRMYP